MSKPKIISKHLGEVSAFLAQENYAFVLLCDEKWWNRLCEQNRKSQNQTKSFVRRNLRGPIKTEKLLFYVKSPVKQIRGTADFVERVAGNSKILWNQYGKETCLKNFREYRSFLHGCEKATFIRFKNFKELENPVPVEVMKKVLGILKIPRGGKYINRETADELRV
jgi:predicted transcriptional regulator